MSTEGRVGRAKAESGGGRVMEGEEREDKRRLTEERE